MSAVVWRGISVDVSTQATVLLLVPYGTTEEDVHVAIEQNSLVARVRGHPPIVKVGSVTIGPHAPSQR